MAKQRALIARKQHETSLCCSLCLSDVQLHLVLTQPEPQTWLRLISGLIILE